MSTPMISLKWKRMAIAASAALVVAGVGPVPAAMAVVNVPIGQIQGQIANHRGATTGTNTGNCIKFAPGSNATQSDFVTSPSEAAASHGLPTSGTSDGVCPPSLLKTIPGGQSAIGVTPSSVTAVDAGVNFLLGTMTHYNNPINLGTGGEPSTSTTPPTGSKFKGDLNMKLPSVEEEGTGATGVTFGFPYTLTETPNSGGDVDDVLVFDSQIATKTVVAGGLTYRLVTTGFTAAPTDGVCTPSPSGDPVNKFITKERTKTVGCLYAKLTQVRTLTLVKEVKWSAGANPAVPAFNFTSTSTLAGSHWATNPPPLTPTSTTEPASYGPNNILVGETVTITEKAPLPTDWSLTDVKCKNGSGTPLSRDEFTLSNNTLTLMPKETNTQDLAITCTYTNTFTPPLPAITVLKTGSPSSVPETGGNVEFTYRVNNTGTVPVTITSLSDDKFGTLAGDADCKAANPQAQPPVVGTTLAAGAFCDFKATFAIPAGNAGTTHTNIFTANAKDRDNNSVEASESEIIGRDDVRPAITVLKTGSPSSVPETGGNVEFTYRVNNTGTVPVTITSLSDDKFGTLAGDADCKAANPQAQPPVVGTTLAAGAFCDFKATFAIPAGNAGTTHTNIFTANAKDRDNNSVEASESEIIGRDDVRPAITVLKTGSPSSVPETGGNVEFTYRVNNTGTVPVTITSLSDDKFGTLAGDADCKAANPQAQPPVVGTTLAAGAFCDFKATFAIPAGNAGTTHTNIFTANAKDRDNNSVEASESEIIGRDDVRPAITVLKTGSPSSVPETGGNVEFTYRVNNTGTVPVTITSLSDDKFGTLAGDADCKAANPQAQPPVVGTTLAAGAFCDFKATFAIPAGNAGTTHTNIFTANAKDRDNNSVEASESEIIGRDDVRPAITVLKTGSPSSVPETGGNVEFTYRVNNTGTVPVTITSLSDDKFGTLAGDADCKAANPQAQPPVVGATLAAGAFCDFKATFAIPAGNAGTTHTNIFTANAKDRDNNSVEASESEIIGRDDVRPAITVLKTGSPSSVPETGGNVEFTYRVNNTGTVPVTITSLSDDKFGTLAGDADCKAANPQAQPPVVGTTLAAGAFCDFKATFAIPAGNAGTTHTNIFTANAKDRDNNSVEASESEIIGRDDVRPAITVLKTGSPSSVPETGGNVEFTYRVNNTGTVPVTITSLSDDKFGTLAGDADCKAANPQAQPPVVGTTLAAGAFCDFKATFAIPAGPFPGTHKNVFTATVKDDDGNTDTATDDEVITYTDLPELTLVKSVLNDDGGVAIPSNFILTATKGGDQGEGEGNQKFAISGPSGDPKVTNVDVPVGKYTLTEEGPVGYESLGWECVDNDEILDRVDARAEEDGSAPLDPNQVILGIGDNVTCTLTNDDTPPIPELEKTADPATGTAVETGQLIKYSVKVSNAGDTAIAGATAVDTLPTGAVLEGAISDGGVYDATARTITWTFDLAGGASKTFTYSVKVTAGFGAPRPGEHSGLELPRTGVEEDHHPPGQGDQCPDDQLLRPRRALLQRGREVAEPDQCQRHGHHPLVPGQRPGPADRCTGQPDDGSDQVRPGLRPGHRHPGRQLRGHLQPDQRFAGQAPAAVEGRAG